MTGPVIGDAFGMAFLAYMDGRAAFHFVERDDGLLDAIPNSEYFTEPDEWPEEIRDLLAGVSGRTLDVGAGAGRHSLFLQGRGCDVTALDPSPGAIETMDRRGVRDTLLGTVYDVGDDERFDALLLLGNNLGLMGSLAEAPRFLGRLRELAAPGARIIGSCIDPYRTDDPLHLAYHERNRGAGRPAGQVTIRIRFDDTATEWLDLLWATPTELAALAERSGWRLAEHRGGPLYWAVLDAT